VAVAPAPPPRFTPRCARLHVFALPQAPHTRALRRISVGGSRPNPRTRAQQVSVTERAVVDDFWIVQRHHGSFRDARDADAA
jgi:hypothetical protein